MNIVKNNYIGKGKNKGIILLKFGTIKYFV